MTIDEFTKELSSMQDYLEITTSNNGDELTDRLAQLNVYLARSGKLLADAKAIQEAKTAEVFGAYFSQITKMPATIAQKFIQAQTKDINYIVNWAERVNRAIVHQGDNIRTQISFEKENLRLTKSGY
ncbi:MAG: hypothetical protein LKK08_06155 [Bacteroidales bacterium]|jgi:hypothetical protein|nr:hypothetical protein [Bacteroidales bacterium]